MTSIATGGLRGRAAAGTDRGGDGGDAGTPRLRANALTLWDSTVLAVTSTAPTYSLASTMYLMVGAVGLAAPATILVSFLPVLGIAVAYAYLNRTNPDCGASYSWLTQAISPWLGWFTGWVQLMASLFFMVQAPILAAQNTLSFLSSLGVIPGDASANAWLVAGVGVAWLVIVTAIVVYGIGLTARFQWAMLAIEYLVLILFSVLAFAKVASQHPGSSTPFSWGWVNPFSIHGVEGLAAGAVLAVFFFWGWDAAANVNEETRDARVAPGQAGIVGMFLLLAIFLLSSSAMQSLLPQGTIANQGANALQYFAGQVLPAPWSYLMLLGLLSSTIAVLQTTLLPAARVTLSMARDGVWPAIFARVNARFQTPLAGTIILSAICIVGLLLTTASPSVGATLSNLVNTIGVFIAFYYGITGIACAWYFRRILSHGVAPLLFAGLLPLLGGLFLLVVGLLVVIQGQQQNGWGYVLPVLVAFALGAPLTGVAWLGNRGYFAYRPVPYDPASGDDQPVGPAPLR